MTKTARRKGGLRKRSGASASSRPDVIAASASSVANFRIIDLGGNQLSRKARRALARLPEGIAVRAAARIPAIVLLPDPGRRMDCDGGAFDNGVILVFDLDQPEVTVLHEIAHVLDPGLARRELCAAYAAERKAAGGQGIRALLAQQPPSEEIFAEFFAWRYWNPRRCAEFPATLKVVECLIESF